VHARAGRHAVEESISSRLRIFTQPRELVYHRVIVGNVDINKATHGVDVTEAVSARLQPESHRMR